MFDRACVQTQRFDKRVFDYFLQPISPESCLPTSLKALNDAKRTSALVEPPAWLFYIDRLQRLIAPDVFLLLSFCTDF